jgi:hypothetical protein
MSPGDNFPYDLRVVLGDPTENEERASGAAVRHKIQQKAHPHVEPSRNSLPFATLDKWSQSGDLEVFFDIDREVMTNHLTRMVHDVGNRFEAWQQAG